MAPKFLKIGILSKKEYRKRTIAIAKGDYRPRRNEPKIWLESMQSMAQILSSKNQELLRIIQKHQPSSLKELEQISGRKRSNLSRTLKTMSRYGIVDLVKNNRMVKPVVKATEFSVELVLDAFQDDESSGKSQERS